MYLLRLPVTPCQQFDDLERLTALMVACAHDVGHTGKANRYHTVMQTPLARLYNDRSVLENMHCAIMFALLQVEASNVLEDLEASWQAVFRSLAVQMILNTDLAMHVKAVSQFSLEFVEAPKEPAADSTPAQRKEILSFLLKCADVGGSAKPFSLHAQWTMRICSEFYAQGDEETALGLPCSPFCARGKTSLRECQTGFFDFVASPMFKVLGEFLASPRIEFEVLVQMEANRSFWKTFDDAGGGMDHNNPMASIPRIQYAFLRQKNPTCNSVALGTIGCSESTRIAPRLSKSAFGSDPQGVKSALKTEEGANP